jgi:hypothetical protein
MTVRRPNDFPTKLSSLLMPNYIQLLVATLVFSLYAAAQTAAPVPQPEVQFFDNNGVPLAGGLLCTYAAGTTTPQATYTSSSASVTNSNPVVLDSAGRASVWLNNLAFKLTLYPSSGACGGPGALWTQDNVSVVVPPGNGFWSSGTASSIFNNNGAAVGIGTGTPLAELNVSGASSGNNLVFRIDDSANHPGITLAGSGSVYGVWEATSNTNLNILNPAGFSQFYVSQSQVAVWDQTPTSGVTGFLIRAGANQPGNDLATWVNNAGTFEGGISQGGESFLTDGVGHTIAQFTQANNGMAVAATSFYMFSSGNQAYLTPDTGICRISAGDLGVMNGVSCSSFANLELENLTVHGSCTGCGGGGGGGGSPGGVQYSVQINNPLGSFGGDGNFTYNAGTVTLAGSGSFQTTGTASGFDATACTNYNCLQAPVGGVFVNLFSLAETAAPGTAGAGGANIYADSTAHTILWSENAFGTFYPFAFLASAGSSAYTNGHCASIAKSGTIVTVTDAGGACTTGGGGGTVVASPQYQLPYYSSSGTTATVTGTTGLTYNPAVGTLQIAGGSAPGITMTSLSLSAAGVVYLIGATSGVDVTIDTNYNAIQTPAGGLYGLSVTALNYTLTGNNTSGSTTPTPTTGSSYTYGAQYFNVGLGAQQLCAAASCTVGTPGTGWVSLGTGSGSGTVSSSVANTIGYYTASTTIGGNSGLTWNPSTTTLAVIGTGIATSGAMSATGVIASSGSSGGVSAANTAANSIQTTGGFNACDANTCAGSAFEVNGNAVISAARAATLTGLTLSSITGLTQCLTVNSSGTVSGTGSACGSGGGGISLTGSVNQVLVNGSTGTSMGTSFTLTLPQGIATSSQPTFAGVISTIAFNANVSTSMIAFQTANTNFQVDGDGDVSGQGSANFSGSTSGLAPYRVAGTAIVNTSSQWIGGAILSTGNVQAGGSSVFAIAGGYFGETDTITIGVCTMYFKGGILYGSSGC